MVYTFKLLGLMYGVKVDVSKGLASRDSGLGLRVSVKD